MEAAAQREGVAAAPEAGEAAAAAAAGGRGGEPPSALQLLPSSPAAAGWRRFVLVLAFRERAFVDEVSALLDMQGARYVFPIALATLAPHTPYIAVDLPEETAEDTLAQLLARSVLVRLAVELWGSGPSWAVCTTSLSASAPPEAVARFCRPELSLKIETESFGMRKGINERLLGYLDDIAALRHPHFVGPVNLATPDVRFYILEDFGEPSMGKVDGLRAIHFGRLIGSSRRGELLAHFNLKERKLIGNTTMDPALALIMANLAQARPASLAMDPFAGTGGLLYPAAYFGAHVLGTEISYNVVFGRGKSSRKRKSSDDTKFRARDENVQATVAQYGLQDTFLGIMLADSNRPFLREQPHGWLDAIVTDPPYGIREAARKLGVSSDAVRPVPAEHKSNHIPQSQHYEAADVYWDLLDFAARHLVVGGRLVFWLAVNRQTWSADQIPTHPSLDLVGSGEQVLNKRVSRWLITMAKGRDYMEVGPIVHTNHLQ